MFKIPFLRPNPVRLSSLLEELMGIEASGVYTNYGPVNSRLETELIRDLFGSGGCVTVNNATIGLMLAIRDGMGEHPVRKQRFALMPSFTFAATAHAAIWAGLTPLLCDIDEETWNSNAVSEEVLLNRYRDQISIIVPYAAFGNCIDLDRYASLASKYGVSVVVDAAASLGSLDEEGRAFGTGCQFPLVYSMHATKTFATSEGGIIYCEDKNRLARLRAMGSFGFGEPRTATMPGLNSKLSEIAALLAIGKLREFEGIVKHRAALADAYRANLPGWTFQRAIGKRLAYQFMPVLIPESLASQRDSILSEMLDAGIGTGKYFSPHLAEQPYFVKSCLLSDLAVTNSVAGRIISLPLFDSMSASDVERVCEILLKIIERR